MNGNELRDVISSSRSLILRRKAQKPKLLLQRSVAETIRHLCISEEFDSIHFDPTNNDAQIPIPPFPSCQILKTSIALMEQIEWLIEKSENSVQQEY